MASDWWSDDDQLTAALKAAVEAARAVPRDFVEAGKAAYAWHNIDAELAALTYDSASDEGRAGVATRSGPAPDRALLRALTYASGEFAIELEVTADALLGQLVPPEPGRLEVRSVGGEVQTYAIDEIGCFAVRPVPSGSFRLHCQTSGGVNVITDWVNL